MAAGKPLSLQQISTLFEEDSRPPITVLRDAITALQADCEGRGVELKQVASGYRYQVIQDVAPWVGRLWEEKPQRYSRALMETLALIVYRQPITRGDIEEIRGVAVSSQIIKTLVEREWVRVVGHKDVPGRPAMYASTRRFLDYFNLSNLDELPTLAELKDLDSLNAELELGEDGEQVKVAMAGDGEALAAEAEVDAPVEESLAGEQSPKEDDDAVFESIEAVDDTGFGHFNDGVEGSEYSGEPVLVEPTEPQIEEQAGDASAEQNPLEQDMTDTSSEVDEQENQD